MSGCTMSRCWPVKQVRLTIAPSCLCNSAMTGAILIASGRVPKTVRTLSMGRRERPPERAGIEEILRRPADLGSGNVLRALAVAAVEAARRVLNALHILQRAIGALLAAEPVPHHGVLGDSGRADPLDIGIR